MNTIQIILTLIIALAGYPAGLLIAHLTKEELKQGRRWFLAIIAISIIAIVISLLFLTGDSLFFMISALIFIALISLASIIMSKKKARWWRK